MQMWAPGGAVNALQESTPRIVLICTVVELCKSASCVRAYGRMSQHHGDNTHAVDRFFETLSRDTGRRTVRPWPYRVVCLFLSEFVWVRFVQSCHAARVAQVIKGCVSHKNTSSSLRHVPHFAAPDTLHEHSFLPFFWSSDPDNTATIHQRGTYADLPPITGYEPSWIADDQVDMHFTEDAQITELEDLRVKLLSFHQSITASTLWLSGKHRDAPGIGFWWRTTAYSAGFTTVPTGARSKHSERENTRSSSLQIRQPEVQGNLSQCFQARIGWRKRQQLLSKAHSKTLKRNSEMRKLKQVLVNLKDR